MGPGFREVWSAYEVCRRRKRSRPDAIRFEMRALDETWDLTERLASGRYAPSRPVCFVANEAKPREVFAAAFADRVVHHLVVAVLEPFFERRFIADSYACRKGKGTHRAVDRLSRFMRAATLNGKVRAYAMKLDVSNFFPSMDRRVLWNLVERQAASSHLTGLGWTLDVLKTILFHDPSRDYILACARRDLERVPPHKRLGALGPDRGLPIGNLTSQFLANVLLNELDRFVKHEIKARWYVRYVDDMVLVHRDPEVLRRWSREIEGFLSGHLSLSLNPKATRLVRASSGVDFLGYVVRPWYRLVRRRVVGNLWGRLKDLAHELVRLEQGVRHMDFDAARGVGLVPMLNSYLGHFRHARSHRTVCRVVSAFPWLWEFACLVPGRMGGLVARDRFRPPRGFPNLFSQWSFFRREVAGGGLVRQDSGSVMFVRVGRYYEMFEEDADWAMANLGLRRLLPRKGFRSRCGFRRGHLATFVGRVLALGRSVAVLEETGRTLGFVKERRLSSIYRRDGDAIAHFNPDVLDMGGLREGRGG